MHSKLESLARLREWLAVQFRAVLASTRTRWKVKSVTNVRTESINLTSAPDRASRVHGSEPPYRVRPVSKTVQVWRDVVQHFVNVSFISVTFII